MRIRGNHIFPLDGRQPVELLVGYGIGVAEVKSYTIKKIDLGYFGDARKGG